LLLVFPETWYLQRAKPRMYMRYYRSALSTHGFKGTRLGTCAAAALFTGLFVIGDALDVLGEAFLLAHLLKPPEHLFGGFVAARIHFDYERDPFGQTALR